MVSDIWANGSVLIHNKKEKDARRYKKILHNNYRRFVVMVLCATIPTAVIGYAARDLVTLASDSLLAPGIGLILTAVFLIIADVSENGKKIPKDISFTNSFLVGIAQGISTLPGLSRSGTTIAACLISGYDKRFAVKYSFIMAIPAILGAACLEIGQAFSSRISLSQFFIYLAGAVTAGVVGYFSCRKMLTIVRKKKFRGFAIYCLILGSISIIGYVVMRTWQQRKKQQRIRQKRKNLLLEEHRLRKRQEQKLHQAKKQAARRITPAKAAKNASL